MTPKMQGIFRGLVAKAWKANLKRQGWEFSDRKTTNAAKDAWYRSALFSEFGVESSKDLDDDHYAQMCALFEAEIGDSIYWQMRAIGGRQGEQTRRIIHKIREICRSSDLDENYARAIARQALQTETTPLLEDMQPQALLTVLHALKIHARRIGG